MTTLIAKRKWIFFSLVILIGASIITASVFSARKQQTNQQKIQKRVVELPPVVSHVPKLKIANFSVKNEGTQDARAVIEILNTSNLPVMSVEISTKNKGDSGAVGDDGLFDPDNPRVVIPPFGTTTVEMNFGEMVPDAPLVVSSAEFADGTAEGDKWSLDAMRLMRARHQELRRAEKEKKQKGGSQP